MLELLGPLLVNMHPNHLWEPVESKTVICSPRLVLKKFGGWVSVVKMIVFDAFRDRPTLSKQSINMCPTAVPSCATFPHQGENVICKPQIQQMLRTILQIQTIPFFRMHVQFSSASSGPPIRFIIWNPCCTTQVANMSPRAFLWPAPHRPKCSVSSNWHGDPTQALKSPPRIGIAPSRTQASTRRFKCS